MGIPDQLISADSHVNPLPTMWRDYLTAGFRDRAPRLESTDEGDFQIFEGRRTPILGINAMPGRKFEEYTLTVRRLSEHRRLFHASLPAAATGLAPDGNRCGTRWLKSRGRPALTSADAAAKWVCPPSTQPAFSPTS